MLAGGRPYPPHHVAARVDRERLPAAAGHRARQVPRYSLFPCDGLRRALPHRQSTHVHAEEPMVGIAVVRGTDRLQDTELPTERMNARQPRRRVGQNAHACYLTREIDDDRLRPRVPGERSDLGRLAVVPEERVCPGGSGDLPPVVDARGNAAAEISHRTRVPQDRVTIRGPDRLPPVVNGIRTTCTRVAEGRELRGRAVVPQKRPCQGTARLVNSDLSRPHHPPRVAHPHGRPVKRDLATRIEIVHHAVRPQKRAQCSGGVRTVARDLAAVIDIVCRCEIGAAQCA